MSLRKIGFSQSTAEASFRVTSPVNPGPLGQIQQPPTPNYERVIVADKICLNV